VPYGVLINYDAIIQSFLTIHNKMLKKDINNLIVNNLRVNALYKKQVCVGVCAYMANLAVSPSSFRAVSPAVSVGIFF
jgi:hypothetical protein